MKDWFCAERAQPSKMFARVWLCSLRDWVGRSQQNVRTGKAVLTARLALCREGDANKIYVQVRRYSLQDGTPARPGRSRGDTGAMVVGLGIKV